MKIEDIKRSLVKDEIAPQNFPKSVNFIFDPFYKEIATQLKTTEISSECTLFSSVEAFNVTKEFSDNDYWIENYTDNEIKNYWFFGQNGQGDLWLFNRKNDVLFYDHNLGKMSEDNFQDFDLNFEKWLHYSFLNKEFDEMFFKQEDISEEQKIEYLEKINGISKKFKNNYPFEL